jgi:hypothetical protein
LRCFAEASSRRDVSRFGFPVQGPPPKSCCVASKFLNFGNDLRTLFFASASEDNFRTGTSECIVVPFVFAFP